MSAPFPTCSLPSAARGRSATTVVLGLALAACAAVLGAEEPQKPTTAKAAVLIPASTPANQNAHAVASGHPTPGSVASAGLRIYVDPDTGEIVAAPTPAQRAALRSAIARFTGAGSLPEAARNESGEALAPFSIPGGVGLYLEGRFRSSLLVRVDAAGDLQAVCTDDDLPVLLGEPGTPLPVR